MLSIHIPEKLFITTHFQTACKRILLNIDDMHHPRKVKSAVADHLRRDTVSMNIESKRLGESAGDLDCDPEITKLS